MKLLIFLALFALTECTAPVCDVVVLNNKNYEKHILKEHVHNPYQLAVDYKTNILFFSYSTEVDEKTVHKAAFVNLLTNEFGDISGVNGGFANAYDRNTHIMYLGGKDGIYTYDYTTKTAKNTGVTDMEIWQMFFCPMHGLLFATYKPDEKAFVYKDGVVKPLAEVSNTKTRLVAVGEHHDIFFANSSGLFLYKTHGGGKVVNLGDYDVNGFASDVNGKLYMSTPHGVYYANESQRKMDVVLPASSEDTIWGAALDGTGSIIYALDDSIVKLTPTTKKC